MDGGNDLHNHVNILNTTEKYTCLSMVKVANLVFYVCFTTKQKTAKRNNKENEKLKFKR